MTVLELISALSKFPADLPVTLVDDYGCNDLGPMIGEKDHCLDHDFRHLEIR